MDANHFLMLILLRFELFDYFNGSCSSKDPVSNTISITQEKMIWCHQTLMKINNICRMN